MSRRSFRPSPRYLLPACALTLAVSIGALLAGTAAVGAAALPAATNPAVTKVLTNDSNGTTTVVTKDWIVVVNLSSSDGFTWTEASAINATSHVVLTKVSGQISSNGSSTTTFDVVGYGRATLVAVGSAKCSGEVCLPLSVIWRANIKSVRNPAGTTG
jgi:hypothetical protein